MSQTVIKVPAKVYLKDGSIKQGEAQINTERSRVVSFGIKGKAYQKEVILKPEGGGKKEKIHMDNIDKVEFTVTYKAFSRDTRIDTYRPIKTDKEEILAREMVPNKLYGVLDMKTFSNTQDNQKWTYYLKQGDTYQEKSLSEFKKQYNCDMEGEGNRAEKISQCVKKSK